MVSGAVILAWCEDGPNAVSVKATTDVLTTAGRRSLDVLSDGLEASAAGLLLFRSRVVMSFVQARCLAAAASRRIFLVAAVFNTTIFLRTAPRCNDHSKRA